MAAIDGINISFEEVSAAAANIRKCNNELNDILFDIRRRVNDLNSTWESDAARKLFDNFAKLDSHFENYRAIIESYADFLTKTVDSYQQTETTNVSNASAFDW